MVDGIGPPVRLICAPGDAGRLRPPQTEAGCHGAGTAIYGLRGEVDGELRSPGRPRGLQARLRRSGGHRPASLRQCRRFNLLSFKRPLQS